MKPFLLHIGICEDELYWQNELKMLCSKKCDTLKINPTYYIYSSGEELLKAKNQLDILFLDEEMNGISGQNVKEILENRNQNIMIVFATNHSEILYECFGKNVYGFLHKPFDKLAFEKLFDKLINKLTKQYYLEFFNPTSGNVKISFQNILYIKAEGNYSRIYQTKNEEALLRKSIGDLEKNISYEYLIRVHKSYIVNLNYCKKLNLETATLTLQNNTLIPIARRRKPIVQKLFSQFILEKANQLWDI